MHLGNHSYTSSIVANGSKTALVSTYKNGSDDAYTYAYDANGNITSITKGSMSFTYTYDAANQLVRENLCYGSGNSNNATYTYSYDQWGNILNRKQYAYTTGALGAVQNTVNYTYGNDQWKDQLTSYNNQSITYDAMGNPISYLGAALSWNGKQLVSYSNGSNNITYSYNEDGLRLRKTVNGTTTDYYYKGSVLMAMTDGTTTQRFSYDANGKVVSVNYNGTEYYYVRNAQGDIVKLLDNNKNTVVEYTYDSWGKLISTTGSQASGVGINQPFRYRGYVYDTETQWYYLQSRYYDPTTRRFISSDVYLSTGQGVLGHNAYAYCLNNQINMSDDNGERGYFLTLRELGEIHNMVRDRVAKQVCGIATRGSTIERYFRYGLQRGYIDVYCKKTHVYYEIKSLLTYLNRNYRVVKQMTKYKNIFSAIDINMKPGTDSTIAGDFIYKNKCHVYYRYMEAGIVAYTCVPIEKDKSKSYSNHDSRLNANNYATFVYALSGMAFVGIGLGLGAGGGFGKHLQPVTAFK